MTRTRVLLLQFRVLCWLVRLTPVPRSRPWLSTLARNKAAELMSHAGDVQLRAAEEFLHCAESLKREADRVMEGLE